MSKDAKSALSPQAREIIDALDDQRNELTDLCLRLSNLHDVAGEERPVGEAVRDWFLEAGIHAYMQELERDSVNVVARLAARGDGRSLILSSHMDTEGAVPSADAQTNAELRGAMRQGELLIGKGLANNKAQLAAQMMAARVIHRLRLPLRGALIIGAVAQETGARVPELEKLHRDDAHMMVGPHVGEGGGARQLVTRGVSASFALVGEATDFCIATAHAGYVRFRISVPGFLPYTPFIVRGNGPADNPNPVEKAATVVVALEKWARDYEESELVRFDGGVIAPKAQVHEIRSGGPLYTARTDYCHIFLDVRLAPARDPDEIGFQVTNVVRSLGIEAEVTPYDYARGYFATGAEPLIRALEEAHAAVLATPIGTPPPAYLSMWRDSNAFNEAGIPSVAYGPPSQKESMTREGYRGMKIDDIVAGAKVYALAAASICGA